MQCRNAACRENSKMSLQWTNVKYFKLEEADSVEIDPIMYRGVNMKPMAVSSNMRFPPYFYFRFGRKRLSGGVFCHFCIVLCKISRLWNVRLFLNVNRGLMTSLPVSTRPEVVSSGQTVAVRSIYCIKLE